jgi:ribosomal-protein-alanine N-acetyltransferase
MVTIRYRKANLCDSKRIAELDEIQFPGDSWGFEEMEELIILGLTFVAVDTSTGSIVGFVIGSEQVNCHGYIDNLVVEQRYQNAGIATELIRHLIDEYLLNTKMHAIDLHVRIDNDAAIHLYEKCGFIRLQLDTDYYCKGVDAYRMSKSILNHEQF